MREGFMELLAPAGDKNALIAAVQNGADAVYLGTGAFNARRNAANFAGEALNDAVSYCHARGVKVHVTLNTLVMQEELGALEEAIARINESGADAVIVQDFGVARAVRQMAPELQLHASTQMAVHNPQGVAFLAKQGFDRAVLAREMTFGEMAECAKHGIEIETFVHGALCVACSGQCLMSSLVGGRSGNRGLCAQPCRLPWRLDRREGHLLSTRDLCLLDDLARLRDAGVASLKIEGRLKRAEYVAVTVAAYRRALDAIFEGRDNPRADEDRAALKQMFNRGGFTRGYGPGVSDVDLMYPERPNHLGVPVGECRKAGEARLDADVESADALVLRRPGGDAPVKLSGAAGETVPCRDARRGDQIIRLVSEAQMREARACLGRELRLRPVSIRAEFRVGQPPKLSARCDGHDVHLVGPSPVEPATGRGFDRARAEAQLSKAGGTPFEVVEVEIDADANAFCPASMLNGLRRDALDGLLEQMGRADRGRRTQPMAIPEVPKVCGDRTLMAQSGDIGVLARALDSGADVAVYCPEDLRADALGAVDLSPLAARGRLALALPAVLSGEALDNACRWANAHAGWFEATFLSNIGQLGLDWPGRRVGDYMLNAGNDLTVRQLADWGLEVLTPSVELNAGQVRALGGGMNLIVWGRVPVMHLRHCPLRAARGWKGRHADCRNCDGCAPGDRLDGKALVDRKGAVFPLNRLAMPGGCVIQVLNSATLMPLKRLNRLPDVRAWRLLLRGDEPVEDVVRVYRAALDGRDFKSMPEWAGIDEMNTTTGHYFRGVE